MNTHLKVVVRCLSWLLLLTTAEVLQAQTQNPSTPSTQSESTQTANQQQMNLTPIPDLGQLNLTPDQREKIRTIWSDTDEQRKAVNGRVRVAQRALTEAIDSPTPNDALIEQRSRELADARAEAARFHSLMEARILQVLTTEQRVRLREMRRQAQMQQRLGAQQGMRNGLRKQNGLPRNPTTPFKTNQRVKQPQKP